ncbi:unnamed protein product [Durusdinium trenchii]|uniref:Uncharacterized protein n=1 Tax=Durusdinium trenchii TaxID=1381693 RepID=A0ABP0RID0_9DINO
MEITTLSGATVTQLHEEELACMVESGSSVRDLNRRLTDRVGFSRFRQRLLNAEVGELQDDVPVRQLPPSLQLVILNFCAPKEAVWEALLRACEDNRVAAVRRLLQKPLDPNGRGAETDPTPPPMFVAAERGHLEVVRLLLEAGANQNAARANGTTALKDAARNGHLEVVRLLLEAGADKNAAQVNGTTALMAAAEHGHLEVVRLLR